MYDQSAKRSDIIAHIRKLQQFTTGRGASETEASFAMARVAEMIAEYNITQDELSIRADAAQCITDEFLVMSADREDWAQCLIKVAQLYKTKCWTTRSYEDPLGLDMPTHCIAYKFFGFPSDVAASIAVSTIIANAINHEASRTARGINRQSFRLGMIDRINERLYEMTRVAGVATSGALIVLKGQLVTDEFAKLNLRLGKARATTTQVCDAKSFTAGQHAGSNVNLGGTRNAGQAQRAIATR